MVDPRRIRTRAEWTQALQALFAQARLSYHVLAEQCGTSASTLQKLVTGQSFPRPSTVRLFVQACGENDAQQWIGARARVAAADVTLKRPRTRPGRQVRIGVVPRAADSFQDREVSCPQFPRPENGGQLTQWRGTRRARSPRTRRCWPTLCGCWVPTISTPWPTATAWRGGGGKQGTRRARPPRLRRWWLTICGCWVATTPTP
jgi:transcriptional regulator with XRE-family HTH domain